MKLVFIRHTSVAVPRGVCYGQSDVPLAGGFPDEAVIVKRNLEKYSFDAVYSSPLSRCLKLAAYCGYDTPILDSRLMEMNFGDWEMKRYDEITDSRLQLWYDDFLNVPATGGESSMQQRARFLDFISDLRTKHFSNDNPILSNTTIAIFTHGGIIIHAFATLRGMSDTEAFASQPTYGEIVEMEV
ncbi:alpha-ribazole phosphatase family protein [uncultured Duncaniella sp.]|uniref:alpha-ribazole phosphatase family protein n=1 Tax=uncultured Duncaniella sp. TaxID=2768039 RepID=UPI00260024BF|nr:alpha-ribazole phosphatase family protein [uncultured Duncaniella sp.]